MAGNSKRNIISLACQECKRKNYSMTKNKRLHPERVEYVKFCRWCRSHTPHKETK
ncbi:MAG: 50S ribosomal protein L33 [Candidatus Marinimicrobia bacterium]|nr:50S ribosomal protein L33 [Candidatus Neomarinimicrobiota bacterium]